MDTPKSIGANRQPDGTFGPGNVANPNGRPVGSVSIMGKIRKIFEEHPERFDQYVEDVLGDKMMRREIVQQLDGKPIQPISGVEGQPLIVKLIQFGTDNTPQPEAGQN
jgi:hypothetical protein